MYVFHQAPPNICKKKWSNLVKTYTNCKDMKRRTGKGPTRFQFFDELDEILGDKPNIASPHTIDISETYPHAEPQHEDNLNETGATEESNETEVTDEITNEAATASEIEEQVPTTASRKRKSVLSTIKEDILKLKDKVQKKEEHEQRKLRLLETRLTLEERKVKALESIAEFINK